MLMCFSLNDQTSMSSMQNQLGPLRRILAAERALQASKYRACPAQLPGTSPGSDPPWPCVVVHVDCVVCVEGLRQRTRAPDADECQASRNEWNIYK